VTAALSADSISRASEDAARAAGAVLFGVAAVPPETPAPFRSYPRAAVAALPLSRGVLATCVREPSRAYACHYRAVNAALDHVATRVAAFLEREGFATYAVPASHIADWDRMLGAVSHVRLAVRAGLGFVGKNNLLVTPAFGAGVRLVSVFTDAPLAPAEPAAGDCGACDACARACPAGAIGDSGWDRDACLARLREFRKAVTNQHICGVCVRACAAARAGPAPA